MPTHGDQFVLRRSGCIATVRGDARAMRSPQRAMRCTNSPRLAHDGLGPCVRIRQLGLRCKQK